MIFEALLLLPRADNRPGNRYVLWRRLRLAPFFILEVNIIELHKIGGKYEVYHRNEFIGTLETYSNPHHLTNCYIKLNLIKLDSSISMELFTRLRAVVGNPIQAMGYFEQYGEMKRGSYLREYKALLAYWKVVEEARNG